MKSWYWMLEALIQKLCNLSSDPLSIFIKLSLPTFTKFVSLLSYIHHVSYSFLLSAFLLLKVQRIIVPSHFPFSIPLFDSSLFTLILFCSANFPSILFWKSLLPNIVQKDKKIIHLHLISTCTLYILPTTA